MMNVKSSLAVVMALSITSGVYAQAVKSVNEPYQPELPIAAKPEIQATPVSVPVRPVPVADAPKTWAILPSDLRLANALERWAKTANMKLVWAAQKHVLISTSDTFAGTFAEALDRVLSSPAILKSDYPLEACIYPNTPPVVRITRLGEQTNECPQ